jgi:hypothetical protein
MENKNIALLFGGIVVAGAGYYFWQKNKTAPVATPAKLPAPAAAPTNATPKNAPAGVPAVPATPAPVVPKPTPVPNVPIATPPAIPSAGPVAAPAGVSFNEMTPDAKVAVWQAASVAQLDQDPSNPSWYSISANKATSVDDAGSFKLINLNDAQGGNGLYLLAIADQASGAHTIWAAVESDAVAMASGPGAAWTVFLRPNEWRTVSDAAYQQTLLAQAQTAQQPSVPSIPGYGQLPTSIPTGLPTSLPSGLPSELPSNWPFPQV